jgi:hypothetical protein
MLKKSIQAPVRDVQEIYKLLICRIFQTKDKQMIFQLT